MAKENNIGIVAVQPTPRWSFNGTNLQDIYDATYPIEE